MTALEVDVERVGRFRYVWTVKALGRVLTGKARSWRRAKLRAYQELGLLVFCATPTVQVAVEIPRESASEGTSLADGQVAVRSLNVEIVKMAIASAREFNQDVVHISVEVLAGLVKDYEDAIGMQEQS